MKFQNPMLNQIVDFLRDIGLEVEADTINEKTFMPGIHVREGRMFIDEDKLSYPGDVLHEAGHMAIFTTERRKSITYDFAGTGGDEMAAIAWSYAAARHLNIDPAVVFHPDGYKGDSESLLENFENERYIGVPMLDWLGMTHDPFRNEAQPVYPKMLRWVVDDATSPR